MVRRFHSSTNRVVAGVIFALHLAIAAPAAAAGPAPLRDPEPLALPRSPDHLRTPVELVPKAVALLPLCGSDTDAARCSALGPAFGPELTGLYRPTPYFAFGGTFGYAVASGSLEGASVRGSRLELSVTGRVYLLETGSFDPYLEAFIGWASARTRFQAPGAVADEDTTSGPFGRAGGGVDWFVGSNVKLGVLAAFSDLLFGHGVRCRAGHCATGDPVASTISGAVTLGFGASVLFGQAL